MKILDKDERWLTDVAPINYKTDDIIFYEMKINWSYAWCIADMIKWNNYFVGEETFKIPFWEKKEIYHVWWKWNSFVLVYENKQERDKDIDLLKKYFKLDWKYFSKLLEKDRHVAEMRWYFEYNWRYYTIVEWLNKLTSETNPELWIYKWVIVCPSLYFWKVWEKIKQVEDKVDDILE
jgi:hypothetical protein